MCYTSNTASRCAELSPLTQSHSYKLSVFFSFCFCLLLLNREWKEMEQMATTQQITVGHHEVLDSTQILIRSVLHYY